MTRSILALLGAAALAAALGSADLQASRLDKPDARLSGGVQANDCVGCGIYVRSTSGAPLRLDRGPRGLLVEAPTNSCADPGVTLSFPEEGEHLAAFLNSRVGGLK